MKKLSIPKLLPFTWLEFRMDEFEDFKNTVESWEVDFIQLDKNDFSAHLRQLILPYVQLGHTQINGHIAQNGIVPEGMWTFVIPHKNSSIATYNHLEAQNNDMILIYPPGTHFSSNTYDDWEIYAFSIEENYLKDMTELLGLDEIENKLQDAERVNLEAYEVDKIRNQLENILQYTANLDEQVFNSVELEMLYNLIPAKIIQAIHPHMGCDRKRLLKEKHILYIEARSYMHTHIHEDITVKTVAETFNLTERTLHNYFKKELDISPKRYLTVLRLTKIHNILKNTDNKKGIIEKTARKFGFYHMGQFSKSYKAFFKELPSETLRQD